MISEPLTAKIVCVSPTQFTVAPRASKSSNLLLKAIISDGHTKEKSAGQKNNIPTLPFVYVVKLKMWLLVI